MSDEMDAWTQSWSRVKTHGIDTSELATALVQRAFRGDSALDLLEILETAADDQCWNDIALGALRLCTAISRRNRTPSARMEITVTLLDTGRHAPARKTRAAASLIFTHQMANDAVNFADIDRLDPTIFYNLGASGCNQILADISELADLVVIEALAIWRRLMPEVSSRTVKDVAGELWSEK